MPARQELARRLIPWLLAALSGLLVALSFPDHDLWPLTWVALVPLLAALEGGDGKRSFFLGLVAGTTANLIGFFWMVNLLDDFGQLPFALAVLLVFGGSIYQGLAMALSFGLSCYLKSLPVWRPVLVATVYTAVEAFHPILFPWFLGNSQYRQLHLIQLCDLLGVPALTWMLVAGNAVGWELLGAVRSGAVGRREWGFLKVPLLFLGLVAAALGYGHLRIAQVEEEEARAERLTLGVVEPEIGIFEEQRRHYPSDHSPLWLLRFNNLRLQEASAQLARQGAELVVWPESVFFPALSTYARTDVREWMALGTKELLFFSQEAAPVERVATTTPLLVAASGAGRTLLAGARGELYRLERTGLVREPSESRARLSALHLACLGSRELADTAGEDCRPMAAGAAGTLLQHDAEGWTELASGTERDLHSLTSLRPGEFIAGGEGIIIAGNILQGTTQALETPGQRWLHAVALSRAVLLLSERGDVANVGQDGAITLAERPLPVTGTVADVAVTGSNRLLLATSTGLFRYDDGRLTPLAAPRAFRSVGCDLADLCFALDDSGQVWRLAGDQLLATGLQAPGATRLRPLAYERHYWWIPSDAVRLYRSSVPLPRPLDYPDAVLADEMTAERDRNAVQRAFETPLLFGSISGQLRDPEAPNGPANTRYNSAFLIDREGRVRGRYDKQYLLAFGEYIPLGDIFPIFYEWSPASGRFEPGPGRSVFDWENHKLGLLICYEDIIPSMTNAIASQGANLLVNLTNDAWFGKTKEAWQHFALATFRAVEQRLPLVRATTTGISGTVSATGRITHMTSPNDAETFIARMPLLEGGSVYRSGGRHFALVLLALVVGATLWRRFSGTRIGRRRSAT